MNDINKTINSQLFKLRLEIFPSWLLKETQYNGCFLFLILIIKLPDTNFFGFPTLSHPITNHKL